MSLLVSLVDTLNEDTFSRRPNLEKWEKVTGKIPICSIEGCNETNRNILFGVIVKFFDTKEISIVPMCPNHEKHYDDIIYIKDTTERVNI